MPPCCGNPQMGAFLKLAGPLNHDTGEELKAKLVHIPGLNHIIKKAGVFYAHLHFNTVYDAAEFAQQNLNKNILVEGLACAVGPSYEGRRPIQYASLYEAAAFAQAWLGKKFMVNGSAVTVRPGRENGFDVNYADPETLLGQPTPAAAGCVAAAAITSTHAMQLEDRGDLFVVRIHVPELIISTVMTEVEEHKTIFVQREVERRQAGNFIFYNVADRLSVVLPLPSSLSDEEGASFSYQEGVLVIELRKEASPQVPALEDFTRTAPRKLGFAKNSCIKIVGAQFVEDIKARPPAVRPLDLTNMSEYYRYGQGRHVDHWSLPFPPIEVHTESWREIENRIPKDLLQEADPGRNWKDIIFVSGACLPRGSADHTTRENNMPASEQSIHMTNLRFHRKQVMSKNSRGGRAFVPSQPLPSKRKPIDAAAARPGVTVIATCHGDLPQFVSNRALSNLGGRITVSILGDVMAGNARADFRKVKEEREEAPVFDTLVEAEAIVISGPSTTTSRASSPRSVSQARLDPFNGLNAILRKIKDDGNVQLKQDTLDAALRSIFEEDRDWVSWWSRLRKQAAIKRDGATYVSKLGKHTMEALFSDGEDDEEEARTPKRQRVADPYSPTPVPQNAGPAAYQARAVTRVAGVVIVVTKSPDRVGERVCRFLSERVRR
ncbi:hypothetical protein HDU88_002355 [Geranomyces variabilis]|nr:hypothetical protein HDU88_002355 [Geranomyces variabilis]